MIVLDPEEVPSQPKLTADTILDRTRRAIDSSLGEARPSSPILPDYETSEAQQQIIQNIRGKGRRRSKFWTAALYATVLYVALFVVAGIPLILLVSLSLTETSVLHLNESYTISKKVGRPRHRPPNPLFELPPPNRIVSHIDLSIPLSAGEEAECNTWHPDDSGTSYIKSSSLSSHSLQFTLPVDKPIVIRSNISTEQDTPAGLSGHLYVDINPDVTAKDALVSVTVRSSHHDLFEESHVCLMKSDNRTGISLYVPELMQGSDILSFNMSLLLPAVNSRPLRIKQLSTILPFFDQTFGRLDGVEFKRVLLEGLSSKVTFDYIKAHKVSVKTTEQEVSGTFNISDALTLDTINGPIFANVTLENCGKPDKPTFMSLDTGNGPIVANLYLLVSEAHLSASKFNPNFIAKARTFNAPMTLSVAHIGATSRLFMSAQNSQGAVNISMDPLYVGTFDLQAKSSSAVVQERHVPGGLWAEKYDGEQRALQYDHTSHSRLLGWVGWGSRPMGEERRQDGHVEVMSSLSPVVLQLDQPA
ncbi:hypothetical protein EW146_g176 [Bondarzewia mesenterica]|uniref:Uncharacterized protein n=1 Tax=Bondarzewia mesenterica TaxID=1095465 RepID=A0A4S4M827_9AGAM|nr:hypothetical protein EW146_g176 [Bondarzewia mesenterica]